MFNNRPIRLLLCAPGDNVEGGIAAVVFGLRKGFDNIENLEYKRILYGKNERNLNTLKRISSEILQLLIFIKSLINYKPDIVHVQSSFDKKTIIRDSIHLWITLLFKLKFVLHAHGGEWHLVAKWNFVWRTYTALFLRSCSKIIVTSLEEMNIIQNSFKNNIDVCKVNNPVELPISIEAFYKDNNNQKKRIIFASRLIETKGILDVVLAMSYLERNDFELYIYGDGPLLEEAKRTALTTNLNENIFFLGEVPLNELLQQYCKSDIFIFPSYHLEGFPMAFFYAVACGTPIITTKVRPIPNLLNEPDNCFWIEPQNSQMLAGKINYLLNHPEIREQMSINNKQLAKQFSADEVANKLMEIYKQLLC